MTTFIDAPAVSDEYAEGSPIDTSERGAPGWWAEFLMNRFIERDRTYFLEGSLPRLMPWRTRRERMNMLWAYYIGQPPLPQVAEQYTETFQQVLRKARATYAPMAINPILDRMEVTGIELPPAAGAPDDGTDSGTRSALPRNLYDQSDFPAAVKDALNYMCVMGEGYLMAVPAEKGAPDQTPLITAADPRVCIGQPDPLNPNRLQAALKVGYDPVLGREFIWLFVDNQRFQASRESTPLPNVVTASTAGFTWDGPPVDMPEIADLGGVPVVQLTNAHGMGEFEPHIDLLDRINDTILQRIVITWYQSFKQRAIIGDLEGDEDEDTAEELDFTDLFRADPGALWKVPPGVTFWESSQAELTPIITSIRDDVKEFAAVSATPLYLITPDAANQSAEGAVSQREGLRFKVKDRRSRTVPRLRHLLTMAFAMAGESVKSINIGIQWGSIEGRSLSEMAAATAQSTGVLSKMRQLLEIWDMSPEEALQNMQELMQDQLLAGQLAPQLPPPPAPASPSFNNTADSQP